MFSSILLDDGPLTVHDFERLGRAPYQLVLASCDSGMAAPVGADELLGLVSSLVPLGAAGIVASILPVNDLAVVPLMLALHEALQRGAPLAGALLAARGRPATTRWPRRRRTPSWPSAPEVAGRLADPDPVDEDGLRRDSTARSSQGSSW